MTLKNELDPVAEPRGIGPSGEPRSVGSADDIPDSAIPRGRAAGFSELRYKILLAASTLLVLLAGALGYAISPAATPAWAAVMAGLALLLPVAIVWPVGGLFGAVFLRHSLDAFVETSISLPWLNINFNLAAGLGLIVALGCSIYFLSSNQRWKNMPVIKWWLFFLAIVSLSLPLAALPLTAFQEWLKIIILFLLFAVGATYFGLKQRREWLEKLILISVALPVIIAFWQIITSSGLIGFGLPSRAFGTYAHPNQLAFNLVLSLGLFFYFWRSILQHKIWPSFIIILGIISLLFTYSRTGLIAFLIMLFILGLLEYPKITIKISLLLIFGYALFFPLNNWLKNNYNYDLQNLPLVARFTKAEEDYNSLDWRLILWQNSFQKIKERPLLGWGYGMFGHTLGPQQFDLDEPAAHNEYLRLFVETGALGVGAYLLLQLNIIWLLFKRWRVYEKRSYQKLQFAVLLAIQIAFLVISASDNIIDATALQWGWMLLLGASLAEPWKHN